jgi:hypothetical protein
MIWHTTNHGLRILQICLDHQWQAIQIEFPVDRVREHACLLDMVQWRTRWNDVVDSQFVPTKHFKPWDSTHKWMDLVPRSISNIGGPLKKHVLAPLVGAPSGHLQAPYSNGQHQNMWCTRPFKKGAARGMVDDWH